MNLTIALDQETSDALAEYVATNKAASPEALLTDSVVAPFLAGLVNARRVAQRTALIPVADEILAASPQKQQAAIAAALAAVRN